MDYVTDTHPIVWYFTDDFHLSKKALDIFEGTIKEGTIIIPAVVLAEIMFIAKKGKISLTFKETLNKIEQYENFEIASMDIDILMTADKIEADIEMHDRLIMATALYFDAILITKDEQIKKAGIVSTIW
jgi:PIN domain nuclease of toxin-antitoxin system